MRMVVIWASQVGLCGIAIEYDADSFRNIGNGYATILVDISVGGNEIVALLAQDMTNHHCHVCDVDVAVAVHIPHQEYSFENVFEISPSIRISVRGRSVLWDVQHRIFITLIREDIIIDGERGCYFRPDIGDVVIFFESTVSDF